MGMPGTIESLLIVEDNPEELIAAQEAAKAGGFTRVVLAKTLAEARAILEGSDRPDAVLSDLFFPAGDEELATRVRDGLLPSYEKMLAGRMRSNPILHVLVQLGEPNGQSPREVMDGFNPLDKIVANAKELASRDIELYEVTQRVRSVALLACGTEVARLARQMGIPHAVITSTYHHDMAFEPLREAMSDVPYVDTLDPATGRKQWTHGIELLRAS